MLFALAPHAAGAGAAAPAWCGERCDEAIVQWNLATFRVIHAAEGYANPMSASRSLAMVHLAMHDAVNGVQPRFAAYAGVKARNPAADPVVAAATAAHDVLAALYPAQKTQLRGELAAALLEAGNGPSVEAGRRLGAEAAAAVLAKRAGDGAGASEPYAEHSEPGRYRFVPGTAAVAAPHWRKVTPFALRSPEQFRVAPPPALASQAYAQAFDEVKAAGARHGATQRSTEQTHLAAFWYEFSDSGWNRVARVVARERRQDLWDRARSFALLNVVMADAYIAGWDSKLHYDFWRPVTAIRMAAQDGNDRTLQDTQWAPLLPTPPVQDHPSTHSALGAAAATVLAHAFGSDAIAFQFASPTAPAERPLRAFAGFSQAAAENADSRVLAGLHFRFATDAGLELGRKVGRYAIGNMLAPLH
jgi:hypothetical protein